MKYFQIEIELQSYARGFHLITNEVLKAIPDISKIKIGQLQVFIKHTSAKFNHK